MNCPLLPQSWTAPKKRRISGVAVFVALAAGLERLQGGDPRR
jgi:hypothetical protein